MNIWMIMNENEMRENSLGQKLNERDEEKCLHFSSSSNGI